MAPYEKVVRASSIKTREQFERACREGWQIVYDEGYPPADHRRWPKVKNKRRAGRVGE